MSRTTDTQGNHLVIDPHAVLSYEWVSVKESLSNETMTKPIQSFDTSSSQAYDKTGRLNTEEPALEPTNLPPWTPCEAGYPTEIETNVGDIIKNKPAPVKASTSLTSKPGKKNISGYLIGQEKSKNQTSGEKLMIKVYQS